MTEPLAATRMEAGPTSTPDPSRSESRTNATLVAERRGSVLADLAEIVGEMRGSRDLLWQLTLRDVRIRYKQAVMGFAWALLMPLAIVLGGGLIRLAMAYLSGGEVDSAAIAGVMVKALPWAFFIGAVGFATPSLTTNMTLVSKIYFPREVLPISATLAQVFDSSIATVASVVLLALLGVQLSSGLLWVPPLVLLLFTFTLAAGLFLSCANLFFRDVKYLVQAFLMFGIFFTPVFVEPAMFGPLGAKLIMLNPLAPMIEGLRLCVVEGWNLLRPLTEVDRTGREVLLWTPWYLAYAAAWSLGGLVGSSLLFHRSEFIFAEYV